MTRRAAIMILIQRQESKKHRPRVVREPRLLSIRHSKQVPPDSDVRGKLLAALRPTSARDPVQTYCRCLRDFVISEHNNYTPINVQQVGLWKFYGDNVDQTCSIHRQLVGLLRRNNRGA